MKQRIIGFDLARAYAIFGMYIVNFNFSFGSVMSPNDSIGHFLNIFTGNSTAIFIICAGMGLSLMCNKKTLTVKEKADLKSKVVKRSWFLFVLGLLLFNWWSGDILHFPYQLQILNFCRRLMMKVFLKFHLKPHHLNL